MTRRQKRTLIRIIIAAALFAAALVLTKTLSLPRWAELLIFLPCYLTAGYDVLLKAVRNIAHGQVFDENFLMALATIGAFAIVAMAAQPQVHSGAHGHPPGSRERYPRRRGA